MTRRRARAAAAVALALLAWALHFTLGPPTSQLVVLCVVPVAILIYLFRTDRRWDRVRQGRCGHCGYDLRGTRGRCPECGKLVPPGTPTGRP